jgi:hypothetical protein
VMDGPPERPHRPEADAHAGIHDGAQR